MGQERQRPAATAAPKSPPTHGAEIATACAGWQVWRIPGVDMPTVLRKGYRFFFWSGDRGEPPHVHVKRDAGEAKVWLDPVALQNAVDIKDHEIRAILRKVREQRAAFLKAWYDHFRS